MQLYSVIIELALFGGQRGAPVGRKEYMEQIILGWYTWSKCWTQKLDPPCMAEPTVGIRYAFGLPLRHSTAQHSTADHCTVQNSAVQNNTRQLRAYAVQCSTVAFF